MSDANTANIALVKPEVGASTDTWGTKINSDLDAIDGLFNSVPALLVTKGGTAANSAVSARANLGILDMGTQAPSAIAVTGGTSRSVAHTTSTIDSTPIGVTTPSTGKFTSVTFSDLTVMTSASNNYSANVVVKTANATLASGQSRQLVLCDATIGSFQVTLPTAVGIAGQIFDVKKTDSTVSPVVIGTTSAQTIDDNASVSIFSQFDSYTVVSDGTNWRLI